MVVRWSWTSSERAPGWSVATAASEDSPCSSTITPSRTARVIVRPPSSRARAGNSLCNRPRPASSACRSRHEGRTASKISSRSIARISLYSRVRRSILMVFSLRPLVGVFPGYCTVNVGHISIADIPTGGRWGPRLSSPRPPASPEQGVSRVPRAMLLRVYA